MHRIVIAKRWVWNEVQKSTVEVSVVIIIFYILILEVATQLNTFVTTHWNPPLKSSEVYHM